ncbi:glucooligosaccharide oxidase [Crepidotus variabilis]|uniref:Glucooligosaccharide oxidase n=1 Tax=Crepidotus variabilis TaxID=179855 RepID=A0A9P6JLD5_9AGAR|nr:glucooligosaccharide oxidase [Crepidotus variabilis]
MNKISTIMRPTILTASLGLLIISHVNGQSLKDLVSQIGYNVSIVLPGQPGYANATKPFNLRYDYKPVAVAFPVTSHEVSEVVQLGLKSNHTVVARSGGHSYIANGLGGKNDAIVIDLRNMKSITVDDQRNTAVVQTGNLLGDILTTLNEHDRALPHGTCPYVGIGGHAGYGGYGFTSRMWGLTIDRITSIEVVLANGEITTASETSNKDLFWAMRGAAGSFGIATAITFSTFPAPPETTIFSYSWHLPAAEAASVLTVFQNFTLTGDIPPQLAGELVITKADIRGNVNLGYAGGWYAPIAQLNATLAPFFAQVPAPISTSFDSGDYLHSAINLAGGSLQTISPEGTDTFYAKSLMTPSSQPMSLKSIQALMEVVSTVGFDTPGWWFFQVEQVGGKYSAINALKASETAFVHRDSLFVIQFYSSSPGNTPPYPQTGFNLLNASVDAIVSNNRPGWNYGAYANYLDDELPDWSYRYYGSNYQRLEGVKRIYDPNDFFSLPLGVGRRH